MKIYTMPISRLLRRAEVHAPNVWRCDAIKANFIDTTTKNHHELFKPEWDIVMGHKQWVKMGRPPVVIRADHRPYADKVVGVHLLVDDQFYTDVYVARMRKSYRENRDEWHAVLEEAVQDGYDIVLMCFCKDGDFCHRLQLADMLLKVAEKLGIPCELGGIWKYPWEKVEEEKTIGLYLLDENE